MQFPAEHRSTTEELDLRLREYNIRLPYCSSKDQRITVLRKFLLARRLNVEHALSMIRDVVAHREQHSLDQMPMFPAPSRLLRGYNEKLLLERSSNRPVRSSEVMDKYFEAMCSGFSGVYHKCDKSHRPIWIERTGRLDLDVVLEHLKYVAPLGEDPNNSVMIVKEYINEMWGELLEYQRHVHNDPSICQSTVIMDCDGLSTRHLSRQTIGLLQQFLQYDQRYFPEGIHKIYLVNVGYVVHTALSLIKPFLDARVQEKIVLLKPHQISELLEEIAAADLPAFLGGTCSCEGGCVPIPPECSPVSTERGLTHRLSIPAGQRTVKKFTVNGGAEFRWEFIVDGSHSILFSAFFGNDHAIVSEQKLEHSGRPHAFTYQAQAEGSISLVFNNYNSWICGKMITLRIGHGYLPGASN